MLIQYVPEKNSYCGSWYKLHSFQNTWISLGGIVEILCWNNSMCFFDNIMGISGSLQLHWWNVCKLTSTGSWVHTWPWDSLGEEGGGTHGPPASVPVVELKVVNKCLKWADTLLRPPLFWRAAFKKYYAQTYYIHVQYTCTEAMQIKVKVLFMHWSPCT